MSAEYRTPSRHDRRIVRSALEQLLDTASPEVDKHQDDSPRPQLSRRAGAAGPQHRGFTVTYANSSGAAAANVKQQQQQSSPPRRMPNTAGTQTRLKEPSALLFMSPVAQRQQRSPRLGTTATRSNASAHRVSAFAHPSAQQQVGRSSNNAEFFYDESSDPDDEDSDEYSSPPEMSSTTAAVNATVLSPSPSPPQGARLRSPVAVTSPPATSRNLRSEVEQAIAEDVYDHHHHHHAAGADEAEDDELGDVMDWSGVVNREPLYTEQEVQARVQEAMAEFGKRRDRDEAAVLERVKEELDAQASRTAALQDSNDTQARTNNELRERLEEVVGQCEALQQANNELLVDRRALEERMQRVEVDLCHAQDVNRAADMERWKLVEAELRSANHEATSAKTLAEREAQKLRERVVALEGDVAQLSEERANYDADCSDIRTRMAALGGCMTSMESALKEKESTITQLRAKLRAAEIATQDAHDEVTEKLRSSEEALQKQTDEVRRRMHRVAALEADKTTLTSEVQRLRRAVVSMVEQDAQVRTLLERTSAAVRRAASSAATATHSTDDAPSEAGRKGSGRVDGAVAAAFSSPALSLSPDSLERTRTFDDEDNAVDGEDFSGAEDAQMNLKVVSALFTDDDGGDDRLSSALREESGSAVREPRRSRSAGSVSTPQDQRSGGGDKYNVGSSGSAIRSLSLSPPPPLMTMVGFRARSTSSSISTPPAVRGGKQEASPVISKEAAERCVKISHRSKAASVRVVETIERAALSMYRRLSKRVTLLRAELQSRSAEVAGDRTESQKLTEACTFMKTRVKHQEELLVQVQQECDLRGRDLVALDEESHRMQRELALLETQLSAAEEARAALEDKLKTVEAAYGSLQTEHSTLTVRLETVQKEFTDARTQLTLLQAGEAEKVEIQQLLHKESSRAARLAEKIDKVTAERAQLEEQLQAAQGRLHEATEQLHSVRERQQSAKTREGRLTQSHTRELAALQGMVVTLEAQLDAVRGQSAQERQATQERERALRADMEQQQARVSKYRKHFAAAAREASLREVAEHTVLHTLLDVANSVSPLSTTNSQHQWNTGRSRGGDEDGGGGSYDVARLPFNQAHTQPSAAAKMLFAEVEEGDEVEVLPPQSISPGRSTARHLQRRPRSPSRASLSSPSPPPPGDSSAGTTLIETPFAALMATGLPLSPSESPTHRRVLLTSGPLSGVDAGTTAVTQGHVSSSCDLRRQVVASVQQIALELVRLRESARLRSEEGGREEGNDPAPRGPTSRAQRGTAVGDGYGARTPGKDSPGHHSTAAAAMESARRSVARWNERRRTERPLGYRGVAAETPRVHRAAAAPLNPSHPLTTRHQSGAGVSNWEEMNVKRNDEEEDVHFDHDNDHVKSADGESSGDDSDHWLGGGDEERRVVPLIGRPSGVHHLSSRGTSPFSSSSTAVHGGGDGRNSGQLHRYDIGTFTSLFSANSSLSRRTSTVLSEPAPAPPRQRSPRPFFTGHRSSSGETAVGNAVSRRKQRSVSGGVGEVSVSQAGLSQSRARSGDVDGSCPPARPPTLSAWSLR